MLKVFFALLCSGISLPLAHAEVALFGASPIFKFFLSSSHPTVGQTLKIFVQSDYDFAPKQELAPDFVVDGAVVQPVQTTPSLWILNLGVVNKVGAAHSAAANVYVRDAKESSHLKDAISQTDAEILSIEEALAIETSPQRIAELQAQQAEKQQYRARLVTALSNLRTFLKSEDFTFATYGDPANTAYPNAVSVSPQTGAKAGGTTIQITGTNFPTTNGLPTVKLGTKTCTVISSTDTLITAVTPRTSAGVKDLEVIFSGPPEKNTIITNAFFATAP